MFAPSGAPTGGVARLRRNPVAGVAMSSQARSRPARGPGDGSRECAAACRKVVHGDPGLTERQPGIAW
ncbi:MAG: hypothetical protein ABTQ28_13440, partial [Thauera sp.]